MDTRASPHWSTRWFEFGPVRRPVVVHQEAVRQFNVFIEAQQQRLEGVKSSLPATLWSVMILGA